MCSFNIQVLLIHTSVLYSLWWLTIKWYILSSWNGVEMSEKSVTYLCVSYFGKLFTTPLITTQTSQKSLGTLSKAHLCATVTTLNTVKFSTGSAYISKKKTLADNQKSSAEMSCSSSKGLRLSNLSTRQLTSQIKHSQTEEVTKGKVNGPSWHYLGTNLVPNTLLGSGTSIKLSKEVKFLTCLWLHKAKKLIWRKTWTFLLHVELSPRSTRKKSWLYSRNVLLAKKSHGIWNPAQPLNQDVTLVWPATSHTAVFQLTIKNVGFYLFSSCVPQFGIILA